ncbi:MAG: AAA family ATPase [Candidatus Omnitrophica bacterium]|nr:AAA family ATPase [Candidatus Omnitrophota bacterium]
MYLKSLELFGFKSFPQKTILTFDPGITVVVGPNGCGKSNIFDAIKWALGEQSPKSLRGSKMEDVIFNGTENHPPLNYTEVTLTFSNEDNYLPIDYKEVEITRRLYRSGDSQYFINKNPVRLKDIEELFMGTGIGEYSYSFIEQGKVETLLSYKPEEKRLIFDEASGIIKYKEKKKETLKKLQETEENLLRADDIISEVKRQIGYLERQVEKANKYKKLQDELVSVEKKIASIKMQELQNNINSVLDKINLLRKEEEDREGRIAEAIKKRQSIYDEVNITRKKLEDTNSQIITINSRIENYINHIRINRKRIEEIDNYLIDIDSSLQDMRQRINSYNQKVEEENKFIVSVDNNIKVLEEGIISCKELKNKNIILSEEAKKTIELEKNNILHLEEEKIKMNNQQVHIVTNLNNLLARKKRLLLDKARIDEFLNQRQKVLSLLKEEISKVNDELSCLNKNRGELSNRLRDLELLIEDLNRQLLDREKTLVELNSYLEFLKDLKIKYEEFPLTKKVTVIFDQKPTQINKLIASLKDVNFKEDKLDDRLIYRADVEAKIISLPEEELIRRIEELRGEINNLQGKIKESKENKLRLSEEVGKEETTITEKDRVLVEKKQEEQIINEEIERLKEEAILTEKELQDCLEEIEDNENKKANQEKELKEIVGKLELAKNNLEEAQSKLAFSSEEVKRLEIEIAKKEADVKSLREHKESILSKIAILEEERKSILDMIASKEKEKEINLSRKKSLEEEIESLAKSIDSEKERTNSFAEDKKIMEERIGFLEREEADLSKTIEIMEKELENLRTDIYNSKLETQKLDFERAKIKDYLKQVYNVEFIEANENLPQEPYEEIKKERDNLKKKLDSLGEVNLVAIEEFEELNSRYKFLISQKEDLIASQDSLKKAIYKINKSAKETFLEAFTKIEEEFKKYFRLLFGGGRAQLILLDKDNVLESGVEIEVQPPGKKLQNVSLLSGGEKALTAIALIFSIFKFKPSPLCVLDEIDAPLDEANVERFNQLLKEFSPNAQFIVITHNKRTMSRADILYGVTMQEKGISQLVSVKFAEKEVVG